MQSGDPRRPNCQSGRISADQRGVHAHGETSHPTPYLLLSPPVPLSCALYMQMHMSMSMHMHVRVSVLANVRVRV